MPLIIQSLYLFIVALALANLEVQIEGANGWAEKLPTWRPSHDRWYSKIWRKLMKEKPLTGYHLSILGSLFIFLHLPYFWGSAWSWEVELKSISMFFLISSTWDFLWFVINPAFGIKKFKAVEIWWHKAWLGPWPVDYYYAVIISLILYSISSGFYFLNFLDWLFIFLIFIVGSLATMLIRWVIDRIKH